jgi:hypothetical protein
VLKVVPVKYCPCQTKTSDAETRLGNIDIQIIIKSKITNLRMRLK